MDPILEEMRRVKSIADIRESRYRDWLAHLSSELADLARLRAEADAASKPARKQGAA